MAHFALPVFGCLCCLLLTNQYLQSKVMVVLDHRRKCHLHNGYSRMSGMSLTEGSDVMGRPVAIFFSEFAFALDVILTVIKK